MAEKRKHPDWLALRLSGVFFAAYVINMLVGKMSLILGADVPLRLDEVPEFLILFASCIAFVVAVLQREGKQQALTDQKSNGG